MTLNEVLENEANVFEFLSSSFNDEVRLSEHGNIHHIPMEGCYKLSEHYFIWNETSTLTGIKEKLMSSYKQPTRPFQYCIHSRSKYAGVTAACGCAPFGHSFLKTYLVKINEQHCMAYGSKSTSNNTGDIYMWVFELEKNRHELADHLTSCHVLSNYMVQTTTSDYYSRSGLITDGTFCTTNSYTHESGYCRTLGKHNSTNEKDRLVKDLSLCVSTTRSNEDSIVKNVIKCSPESQTLPHWNARMYRAVSNYVNNRGVYSVYRDKLAFLYIYDKSLTGIWTCVSLLRADGRLFVQTKHCSNQVYYLPFLCRKTTKTSYDAKRYNSDSEELTLPVTLTTACVGAFILLVAIIAVVILLRRRFHQNIESNDGDSLDSNNAIELQSIGSSNSGSVTGQNPAGGAVSGPIRRNSVSVIGPNPAGGGVPGPIRRNSVSVIGPNPAGGGVPGPIRRNSVSVIGPNPMGGAVPGRMNACSTSQPTSYGEVPGRIDGGYNCHYSTMT